jgi:hypothetical protein
MNVKLICLVAALSLTLACGSGTRQGKLTGVEASFSASEAVSGQINNLSTGRLILTMDSGEQVKAYYPQEMHDSLRGGQILEIRKIKGTDDWVATRIVKQPHH